MNTRRESGGLIGGLVLLVVGVGFLLANFGYFPDILVERWWPLILIVVGLYLLLRRAARSRTEFLSGSGSEGTPGSPAPVPTHARWRRTSVGGLVLVALGVAFLFRGELGDRAIPALLFIAIGLAALLGGWW